MLDTCLKPPFPARHAASTLRSQVKQYLLTRRPAAGTPLATDTQIVRVSNLSRSTVRRALDQLESEGWVRRRRGVGTLVGERVAELAGTGNGGAALRLAVLVFRVGDLAHDWYTPLVLDGIERVAGRLGLSVELVGQSDRDLEAVGQRLVRSRPAVFACLCADPRAEVLIERARRAGVNCLVAGTPHAHLGLPAVAEDNRQAMAVAVEHLWRRGHRRVAVALPRRAEAWVFERHEAFVAELSARGVADAESLVHWLPLQMPPTDEPVAALLHEFIRQRGVTALVPGDGDAMRCLDTLVRSGRVDVPGELSVVSMEQDQRHRRWLGTADADLLHMPMREIGRKLAEYAAALAAGRSVPLRTALPSTIVAGSTVRTLPTSDVID